MAWLKPLYFLLLRFVVSRRDGTVHLGLLNKKIKIRFCNCSWVALTDKLTNKPCCKHGCTPDDTACSTLLEIKMVNCALESLCLNVLSTDLDSNGYINDYELHDLFKEANLPLPGYKVREIIQKLMTEGDKDKDNRISFEEFVSVSNLRKGFVLALSG